MGLLFHHLDDPGVRAAMTRLWHEELTDLEAEHPRSSWPYGRRFSEEGLDAYLEIIPEALAHHDDDWLEERLADPRFWIAGGPRDQARAIAVTEFNTAYVRGLATVLIEDGIDSCVVYRAGAVAEKSTRGCSRLEEAPIHPAQILNGHRRAYWPVPDPDAVCIPSGANCTHSIRA